MTFAPVQHNSEARIRTSLVTADAVSKSVGVHVLLLQRIPGRVNFTAVYFAAATATAAAAVAYYASKLERCR